MDWTTKYSQPHWNDVKAAVAGGRMLIQEGVNVSGDASLNGEFDDNPKQVNASVAIRSFAGVTADGTLVMGTATGSFPEIANALIAQGVKNAVCMDGGASTMHYAKDSGFKVPAGRELATILAVQTKDGTEVKPVKPTIPSPPLDNNAPSPWAMASISEAKSLELIPEWLMYDYRNAITREEFCVLLTTFIGEKTGKTVDAYRGELGTNYDDYKFSDTESYYVRSIAALKIVAGTGNGQFSPKDPLTREQAATMIQKMVQLIGTTNPSAPLSFTDEASIHSWASEGLDFVTASKIMNGKGETFDPQGTYTREEAYITMLNTFKAVTVK